MLEIATKNAQHKMDPEKIGSNDVDITYPYAYWREIGLFNFMVLKLIKMDNKMFQLYRRLTSSGFLKQFACSINYILDFNISFNTWFS